MPQSLTQILVHIIFSTKSRQPLIKTEIQQEVNAFLAAEARKNDVSLARVRSVEDHVHMIVSMPRTLSVSDLIERLKTASSRWLKTKGPEYSEFQWQRGYGAFSGQQEPPQQGV